MPVVIRAFGCAFKCGQRVVTKRGSMVAHEAQCICNPAARSCPTCEHNGYEHPEDPDYSCGYGGTAGGHFCAENHLAKDQICAKGCEHWVAKC